MVARWSANPLGMLWPEMDSAFVTSGGGNGGPPTAARRAVVVIAAGWSSENGFAPALRRPRPRWQLTPAKDKSTERIDDIVAIIMAIGRAMLVQEEPQPE